MLYFCSHHSHKYKAVHVSGDCKGIVKGKMKAMSIFHDNKLYVQYSYLLSSFQMMDLVCQRMFLIVLYGPNADHFMKKVKTH